jgi:hypothetical protein
MNGEFNLRYVIKHLRPIFIIRTCNILQGVFVVSSLDPFNIINFLLQALTQALKMMHLSR